MRAPGIRNCEYELFCLYFPIYYNTGNIDSLLGIQRFSDDGKREKPDGIFSKNVSIKGDKGNGLPALDGKSGNQLAGAFPSHIYR